MPTQPQDHKPAKAEPFRFTDKTGKSHTLPNADKGRSAMTGRDLRDATVGGGVAMVGYLFKVLEAAKPKAEALDALYDMSQEDAMEVLQQWGDHGDGDGASLGE